MRALVALLLALLASSAVAQWPGGQNAMLVGGGAACTTTLATTTNMTVGTNMAYSAGVFTPTNPSANAASRNSTAIGGDFYFTVTFGAANQVNNIGIFSSAELATFSTSAGDGVGGMASMTNSFYWRVIGGTDGIYKGGSSVGTPGDYANNDVVLFRRVGSTITVEKNGSVVLTYGVGSGADMYVAMGNDNGRTIASASAVGWCK